MRKVSYYSLIEVLAVIALIMLMGGTLYTAFHRYNRDFIMKSTRDLSSKEIFQIREQFCRAVNNCTAPLKISEQKITGGENTIAAAAPGHVTLWIDNQQRRVAVPETFTAELTLEENNRLAVLTLSEKVKANRTPQQYRIAAAAGVK